MEEARVAVRRCGRRDMDAVASIEVRSFRRQAWPRELLLEYAAECPELFLVAVLGGEVVAYTIACWKGERGELASLAVDPAYRRLGAGKLLLESVLRRLGRRGVQRISLMVRPANRAALRLYAEAGFRRVRRVAAYYEDGRDGLLMVRGLGTATVKAG